MGVYDPWGPPAPPRLITVQSARLRNRMLRLWCQPCGRWERVGGAALPDPGRSLALGELWLAGRLRCRACGGAATGLEVLETGQIGPPDEVWRPGERLMAERLRRHWLWDPYDRRDWKAWLGRR